MFEGKTVEEIDAIIKEAKEAKKRIMKIESAKVDAKVRETLKDVKEGDALVILFKGEEVSATFVKLTDKRFTVIINNVKHSIRFDKLVSIG